MPVVLNAMSKDSGLSWLLSSPHHWRLAPAMAWQLLPGVFWHLTDRNSSVKRAQCWKITWKDWSLTKHMSQKWLCWLPGAVLCCSQQAISSWDRDFYILASCRDNMITSEQKENISLLDISKHPGFTNNLHPTDIHSPHLLSAPVSWKTLRDHRPGRLLSSV